LGVTVREEADGGVFEFDPPVDGGVR